nr:asparaginase [Rivibacter subsaxonicus]
MVVLGTGGTIAGNAASATDATGYRAAERGIEELIAALPALEGLRIETEQVAQIDSKNMSIAIWQRLARVLAMHLARPEVGGIVVTHGSDTLEETAYLLQRVLAPSKPVVLTAAMRPATSLQADGPQNLLDAIIVAATAGTSGVLAVVAGRIWSGLELRKVHVLQLDAFDAGDAGPIGAVEDGRIRLWRPMPAGAPLGLARIERESSGWPRVEIIASHAGSDGAIVDAVLAKPQPTPLAGLVVAGTGNATLHAELEAALWRAQAAGVRVWRCSRTGAGPVIVHDERIPAVSLTPWQARVALQLELLEGET